jgi:adenosylcobyric acid synthase
MMALPVMIQGTHSDAGKSMTAAALCRIFAEDGWKTAPFKSQNMALNSYITKDGKEIGRAQGVQAEAAGIEATTDMNPILIKPSAEASAQIVVHGRPLRTMQAGEYRRDYYETGLKVIKQAYRNLEDSYERIVIEGAGSPAEVNLNDRELVNMKVAEIADSPVILVSDIDRGGVFASIVGTLQLLTEQERRRVAGIIINKFRGDISLLEPGIDWLENYTGKPVFGVLPYIEDLALEEEDSLGLSKYKSAGSGVEIDIAVISYPRISNYTDVDPLVHEPDCRVRFVRSASDLGEPDLVILPGSKSTTADLAYLREKGFPDKLQKIQNKTRIVGICGGFQMLGLTIADPDGVESTEQETKGLSFFPTMHTRLSREKVTVHAAGKLRVDGKSIDVYGYEIHMGLTEHQENPWIEKADGTFDGIRNGRTAGSYFHGLFHNDTWRHAYLNGIRKEKNLPSIERPRFDAIRENSFQKLAAAFREHIDMQKLEAAMLHHREELCDE